MQEKKLVLLFRTLPLIVLFVFTGCKETGKGKDTKKDNAPEAIAGSPEVEKDIPMPEYMVHGERVYSQYCLVCHQATGSGVSRLNPPLRQTDFVTGDAERLLNIILNGSNVGLVVNGSIYANAMPGFSYLSDEDIAHVTSYIRNSFGNTAPEITPAEVSTFRSKKQGQP